METNAIAGSAILMQTAQTQQTISISVMKMVADQQKQMANLLAQNAAQMPQPHVQTSDFTFSTYA